MSLSNPDLNRLDQHQYGLDQIGCPVGVAADLAT
jgi:hypothetical protein